MSLSSHFKQLLAISTNNLFCTVKTQLSYISTILLPDFVNQVKLIGKKSVLRQPKLKDVTKCKFKHCT